MPDSYADRMTNLEASTAVGTEVLFENEQLRVWEMVLDPGETCQMHRHPHDHVLIYAEPATIRAQVDGRAVIQHIEDGCVSYRAVGPDGLPPHSITNAADGPSRHFIVELLGPSASDAPTQHHHNGRAQTEAVT
jgi:beta-alanine degradation protein BauB